LLLIVAVQPTVEPYQVIKTRRNVIASRKSAENHGGARDGVPLGAPPESAFHAPSSGYCCAGERQPRRGRTGEPTATNWPRGNEAGDTSQPFVLPEMQIQ